MTDLIKRLEEAEAGIDGVEAWCLVDRGPFGTSGSKAEMFAAALQGSVDDAFDLASAVLPGWRREVAETNDGRWYACLTDPKRNRRLLKGVSFARHSRPALALCIAVLKATDTGREA